MVKKKSIYPYLLVAPALLIILCVVFIPVVDAIGMSFQSYDLRRPQDIQFIGLQNYVEAFQDKLFWRALGKTVIWGSGRCRISVSIWIYFGTFVEQEI